MLLLCQNFQWLPFTVVVKPNHYEGFDRNTLVSVSLLPFVTSSPCTLSSHFLLPPGQPPHSSLNKPGIALTLPYVWNALPSGTQEPRSSFSSIRCSDVFSGRASLTTLSKMTTHILPVPFSSLFSPSILPVAFSALFFFVTLIII